MKAIRIIFVIFFFLLMILAFLANGQSDRKIEKKMQNGTMHIMSIFVDTRPGFYDIPELTETVISCGPNLSTDFYFSKKRIVLKSGAVTFDLVIKKRGLGKYDTWLAFDKVTEVYYYVTGVSVGTSKVSGILFKPVTEDGKMVPGRFGYIISASPEICN